MNDYLSNGYVFRHLGIICFLDDFLDLRGVGECSILCLFLYCEIENPEVLQLVSV